VPETGFGAKLRSKLATIIETDLSKLRAQQKPSMFDEPLVDVTQCEAPATQEDFVPVAFDVPLVCFRAWFVSSG
jgi:hypothetical protein